MSRLPGRVVLTAEDEERWSVELAGALVAIHSTELADYPEVLDRPAIWHRLPLGAVEDDPLSKAAASAIALLRETEWKRVFCHGDFHPGNALYLDERLVGDM